MGHYVGQTWDYPGDYVYDEEDYQRFDEMLESIFGQKLIAETFVEEVRIATPEELMVRVNFVPMPDWETEWIDYEEIEALASKLEDADTEVGAFRLVSEFLQERGQKNDRNNNYRSVR